MPFLTSSKEKLLWTWSLVVVLAIYSTLFISPPLLKVFESQDLRAAIFLIGMILVGVAILVHALTEKSGKTEFAIIIGILAIYIMFALRMGMPERSHLMEYSVLAIFVHRALIERFQTQIWKPAVVAFLLTLVIGLVDECLQVYIPDRVFDPTDMLFNGLAALAAIGPCLLLQLVRKIRGSQSADLDKH